VASGLSQAAIHPSDAFTFIPLDKAHDPGLPAVNGSPPAGKGRQPQSGPSILWLLRQIYDNPKLTPVLPYDPNALLSKRIRDLLETDGGIRLVELHELFNQFDAGSTPEALNDRVEELIFVSTLLAFGTGRPHRKPRVDFFIMHLLTSSLFIPSYLKVIPSMEHKRALIKTFLQPWGTILMIRGRPRIDATLLMSYTETPLPPTMPAPNPQASASALGKENTNPWPAMISDVIHAPDAHTVKTLRSLLYGATQYGTVAKGEVIGAWGPDGKETHVGIGELDGTVFVRAAGVLLQSLGWVTHGQEEGAWDRSGLGWDDAWKGEV
jgi:Questin oxidase-like